RINLIFNLVILTKTAVEGMAVFQYANLAKWYTFIFSMFCINQLEDLTLAWIYDDATLFILLSVTHRH
ncbi:hypothetical protein KU617_23275, partial [Salmonella enterica subsp. enterica serovar Montevideo]|nr:hypothetical protein [Salmonella enterica subsp. enterica serovar Montevideo]